MKTFLSIWLVILLLQQIFVQQSFAQNLKFDHLTIENGLSHNMVKNIIEDKKGYLWFGTDDGLNRYDGYNFKVYKFDPADSTSLSQNEVTTLWEDSAGNIWIGTSGGGLSKFNPTTEIFAEYKPKGNNNFRAVSTINEDKEGLLWIGTYAGELHRFNKHTGEFSSNYDLGFNNLPDSLKKKSNHDFILAIFKDHSGTLWMGNTTGLHQLNLIPATKEKPSQISFTHYQHDPKNNNSLGKGTVSNIFEDHTGMLWISAGGLNRFDRKTSTFTRYLNDPQNPHSLSHNRISKIGEDKQGNLWIGTYQGLNRLNKERTQFTSYKHDESDPASPSSNSVSSFLIDKSGTLWLGTADKGISKTSPQGEKFPLYRHNPFNNNSLSNRAVTALWEDRSGFVWIGTHNGGLNRFDKKTGQYTHYRHDAANSKSLWDDNISDILQDKAGNLWIAHPRKVSKLNRSTGEFEHSIGNTQVDNFLDQTMIHCLYEDGQGFIWVGTAIGLIQYNSKTNQYTYYNHEPGKLQSISDYRVQAILEDTKGNLWLGHGSIALTKLNRKTGKFTQYKHSKQDSTSISSVVVKSIHEDLKGDIWFGTIAGGLCRYNYQQDNFTTFTEKHGLANNTIYSILEDNQGNLWLGTNKGLSRFSLSTHTFTNYDVNDGLQSNQFAGGGLNLGSCFKGKDGTLYFGGSNGFNAFDPNNLPSNTYVPPIVITGFRLFDKLIPGKQEASEIKLNHNQNFFSFEFAALNFTNSQKNQYAYRLEGLEPNWVNSGTRRLASYTDVGPGTYTLRVKGSNNDGVWNEKGTSIRIIIHPPWWRSWWAYSFYGLCFLAAGFAVDRYQRKRLIQKEREKAQERELEQAHEIEKAYKELKQTQAQLVQKEKMASLGELTAGIAHEIQNPLNFVNNFSEVNTELIEELQTELKTGNTEEAFSICNNIKENEQKISLHGKRADSIVKGMLQHSRASTGQKVPTDINALTEEYLRLSYYGLRAKDKDFHAQLVTEFDKSIETVEVIPQEIGRVLLNLLNNAFYATQLKKAQQNGQYQPEVKVSTCRQNGQVEIRVRDNGKGIPDNVKNKIFQPFFTTKPVGQGTGLGLSLSYDIITKSHQGELRVESQEELFAEFIIHLPI